MKICVTTRKFAVCTVLSRYAVIKTADVQPAPQSACDLGRARQTKTERHAGNHSGYRISDLGWLSCNYIFCRSIIFLLLG